jgi:O-antigen/teichoic acid export membrane protein
MATIVDNITTILIGRFYKSGALGYYTRATQYSDLAAYTINDVFNTVTFPVLSSLQDDKDRLVKVYSRTLFYTAFFTFPFLVLFALLAEPIVIIMLTDKWLPCVPLLQVLCIARMFTPISSVNMNLLNAVGRSDLFMKLDLYKIPFILLATILAIPFGVEAIVWSNLLTTFICFFVNAYLPGKMFGYGPIHQLRDWKYIIISVIVMIVVVYLLRLFITNIWWQLILGLVIGPISYLGCCMLFKQINIDEVKSLITRS